MRGEGCAKKRSKGESTVRCNMQPRPSPPGQPADSHNTRVARVSLALGLHLGLGGVDLIRIRFEDLNVPPAHVLCNVYRARDTHFEREPRVTKRVREREIEKERGSARQREGERKMESELCV